MAAQKFVEKVVIHPWKQHATVVLANVLLNVYVYTHRQCYSQPWSGKLLFVAGSSQCRVLSLVRC